MIRVIPRIRTAISPVRRATRTRAGRTRVRQKLIDATDFIQLTINKRMKNPSHRIAMANASKKRTQIFCNINRDIFIRLMTPRVSLLCRRRNDADVTQLAPTRYHRRWRFFSVRSQRIDRIWKRERARNNGNPAKAAEMQSEMQVNCFAFVSAAAPKPMKTKLREQIRNKYETFPHLFHVFHLTCQFCVWCDSHHSVSMCLVAGFRSSHNKNQTRFSRGNRFVSAKPNCYSRSFLFLFSPVHASHFNGNRMKPYRMRNNHHQ